MQIVYKYPIRNAPMRLPVGAEILTVGVQHGQLMLWAKIDTEAPTEERCFQVFGTGHEILPGNRKYLGTVFQDVFVFHVFERV